MCNLLSVISMGPSLTLVKLRPTVSIMGTRQVDRGPTGVRAAANLRAVRETRGLSLARLSERLTKIGRPMLPSGISKLESGDRRMDVDDLMALSVALGINPSRLLLPVNCRVDEEVALTERVSCPVWRAWQWAEGIAPFDVEVDSDDWVRDEDFQRHSRPPDRRQAEQHPAARVATSIRERVLRLVRRPTAPTLQLVERDLERLRLELDELRDQMAS